MKTISENLPRITIKQWWKGVLSFLFFVSSSQIFTLMILIPPPPKERERRKLYKLLLWWYAGLIVRTHMNIHLRIKNEYNESFHKPAIMIANHQSILDVPVTMMLSPKILIVTNDWAYSPGFHFFIGKYLDIYSINKGLENYVDDLKKWIDKGYQILIFPEGVRWGTGKIERFHKGAFYLAQKLNVDILPLLLHGTGTINSSRQFYLKEGLFTLKIQKRISPDDKSFGETYQEQTSRIMQWYRTEYKETGETDSF